MIGLCDELYYDKDINFSFIEYKSAMASVKTRVSEQREYLLKYNENTEESKKILKNADAIIVGHAPDDFIKEYIKTKLIIKSSERLSKDDDTLLKKVKRRLSNIKHHKVFQKYKPLYFGIGINSILDVKRFHLYRDRAYMWTYFPTIDDSFDEKSIVKKYDEFKNSKTKRIVWAGRMVECKKIEDIVRSAHISKQNGFSFTITLVGDGPVRPKIEELVKKYELSDVVSFKGLLPLCETLNIIKASDFLFMSSDKREGWGMVVNNAMNYGTVVIGNQQSGSVSTLLDDNSGFLYKESSQAPEALKLALSADIDDVKAKAINAFRKLKKQWSPVIGEQRLKTIVNNALKGEYKSPYKEGLFIQLD